MVRVHDDESHGSRVRIGRNFCGGRVGVIRAIGCAFLLFTILGIPIALIIWIMGMVSSSTRTAEYNNNLMAQSQGMLPNQPMMQQ